MAQCKYCGKETELYDGGTPVCVQCSEAHESQRKPAAAPSSIAASLEREVAVAAERAAAANAAFHALIRGIPSDVPHPDGSRRLQDASRELTVARQALVNATSRLNDFIDHGTVPEDLKR